MNSTPHLPGYELDQRLLEHPLAEIWRGRSFTGMEVVALVLSESAAADEEVRDRLSRVSRTAALDPGEQQTPLWAANFTADRPYAVTQLVRGQSGAERLLDPLDGLLGNDEESLSSVRSQLAQYGALPISHAGGQALGGRSTSGGGGTGSGYGAGTAGGARGVGDPRGGLDAERVEGAAGAGNAAGVRAGSGPAGGGAAGAAHGVGNAEGAPVGESTAGAGGTHGVGAPVGGSAAGSGGAPGAGVAVGAGGALGVGSAAGAQAGAGSAGVQGGGGAVGEARGAAAEARGGGGAAGRDSGDAGGGEDVAGSWVRVGWKVGAVVAVLVVFSVLYSVGSAIGSKTKEHRPAGAAPGTLVSPAAMPSSVLQPGIVKPKTSDYLPPVPATGLIGATYGRGADVQQVSGLGLPFVFGWPRPPKTTDLGLSPTTVYRRAVTEQNNGAVTLSASIALRPCTTLAACLADRAAFDEEWTATLKAQAPATAKDGRTWLTVQDGPQYRLSMTHAFTADGQSWLVGVVVAAVPGEEESAQRVLNDIWRQTQ